MSNELSRLQQETLTNLLRLGWSIRRIARETGHRRETITRYARLSDIRTAKPSTLEQLPTDLQHATCAKPASPDEPPVASVTATEPFPRSRSSCADHAVFITEERGKGRNATSIYQDLVERHGYSGSYDAVKRFVRMIKPTHEHHAKCRFETAPGQEAQVDYGEGALTKDPRMVTENIASHVFL